MTYLLLLLLPLIIGGILNYQIMYSTDMSDIIPYLFAEIWGISVLAFAIYSFQYKKWKIKPQ
jgi:hypothetical protein